MSRLVIIGALAPLLVLGVQARADWRSPISGARPILPTIFTPQRYVIGTLTITPASVPRPAPASVTPSQPMWSLPLLDRKPSAEEKAVDITPELQDAILRIEPIYDPTRLEGADALIGMTISAGTASMDNVFADRWRRADTDANVNAKAAYIASVWRRSDRQSCDAFTKNRTHAFGDPALTAMDADDCRALLEQSSKGFDDAAPSPIVAAHIDVPVFAAPLPGSRLSSQDFWAVRRARIADIQAHLQRKWRSGATPQEIGLR